MVDCLIFSRDRPMQLDACLRSLALNAPQIESPYVVWTATNDLAREGYFQLGETCDGLFEEQVSFRDTVRGILPALGEHTLFLCDDAITFAPLPDEDPAHAFEYDVISLCLRLGSNTTYCHPRNLEHGLPQFEARDPFRVWDWHQAPDGDLWEWQGREGDFGYPYSLDGMIHRTASVVEWIADLPFVNPNQMEGCVVHALGQRTDVPPLMACYPHSVQVGLPINVVNQTHGNRFGLEHPVETEELNRRFLEGERIDFEAMDYTDIHGAHQELRLEYCPR